MRRFLSFLLLFFSVFMATPLHADEWWNWTMLEFIHEPSWTAGVFFATRFDDADAFTSELASPRVHYQPVPWLDLGVNLTLLNIANTRTSDHYTQFRPEFEITPKLDLTHNVRLELRSRLEGRWNEYESLTTHRFRERAQLSWTFPHALGPWTRIFASNEWLIDLHRQNWTENRCIPLGITFKTGPTTDLDLFYMIDSTRPKADWHSESVLGTYLHLRF